MDSESEIVVNIVRQDIINIDILDIVHRCTAVFRVQNLIQLKRIFLLSKQIAEDTVFDIPLGGFLLSFPHSPSFPGIIP